LLTTGTVLAAPTRPIKIDGLGCADYGATMRKLLVGLGVCALTGAVLLLVLAFTLNRLIARNREPILQQVQAALGRSVLVDDISVDLWRGVGLRLGNVRIADDPRFSDAPFVQAASVTVRARLWSLLRRRPEADRVDLQRPEIHLIRDAAGHWNYTTLKPSACSGAACTAGATSGIILVSTSTPAAPPASFSIRRVTITDGTLLLTDRTQNPPRTARAAHLDLAADDLGTVSPIGLALDAALQDEAQNIHVRGTVGPLQGREAIPIELTGRLGPFGPQQVRIDAIQLKASLLPDALQASDLNGRAFGGSYALSGGYRFASGSDGSLRGQLSGMNLGLLLGVSMPDADKRFGGTAQVALDLQDIGPATNKLNGTVTADVRDGVLKDFNLVNEVLGHVTGLPTIGNLISARIKPKYGRLFSEPSTRFDTLHGSFRIADQRLRTDDLTIVATDYGVRATGWVGFDREADLAGTVLMSKQFSADVAADITEVKYLLDDNAQLAVPFRLRGKLGEAKPRPDADYLITLLSRALNRGAAKDLLQRFLGSKGTPQATPGAGQSGNLIEQRLRDLLGR
jgi:AsmA-like protein